MSDVIFLFSICSEDTHNENIRKYPSIELLSVYCLDVSIWLFGCALGSDSPLMDLRLILNWFRVLNSFSLFFNKSIYIYFSFESFNFLSVSRFSSDFILT